MPEEQGHQSHNIREEFFSGSTQLWNFFAAADVPGPAQHPQA